MKSSITAVRYRDGYQRPVTERGKQRNRSNSQKHATGFISRRGTSLVNDTNNFVAQIWVTYSPFVPVESSDISALDQLYSIWFQGGKLPWGKFQHETITLIVYNVM